MKKCAVLLIDGLSSEYIRSDSMPFLYQLSQKSMCTVCPPTALFNAHSYHTGVYADKHGQLAMFCHDQKNSPFSDFPKWFIKIDALTQGKLRHAYRLFFLRFFSLLQKRPMFDLAEIPLSVARFFRIPSEEAVHCQVPTILDILDAAHIKTTWTSRDYQHEKSKWLPGAIFRLLYNNDLLRWIKHACSAPEDGLIFAELSTILDSRGHHFGPGSPKMKRFLVQIDQTVKQLYTAFNSTPGDNNFFIVSDHGMTPVTEKIDVLTILREHNLHQPKDFVCFLDSTAARFWPHNDSCANRIKQALSQTPQIRFLTEQDFVKYRLPTEKRWGEMIAIVRSGCQIVPDYFHNHVLKGMHGYLDCSDPGSKPLMILNGPRIKAGKHSEGNMVDLAPTILNLFDIPIPQHMDGKSLLDNSDNPPKAQR